MGKGSSQRPKVITDEDLEEAWNRIFNSKPNDKQFKENVNGSKSNSTDPKKNEGER